MALSGGWFSLILTAMGGKAADVPVPGTRLPELS